MVGIIEVRSKSLVTCFSFNKKRDDGKKLLGAADGSKKDKKLKGPSRNHRRREQFYRPNSFSMGDPQVIQIKLPVSLTFHLKEVNQSFTISRDIKLIMHPMYCHRYSGWGKLETIQHRSFDDWIKFDRMKRLQCNVCIQSTDLSISIMEPISTLAFIWQIKSGCTIEKPLIRYILTIVRQDLSWKRFNENGKISNVKKLRNGSKMKRGDLLHDVNQFNFHENWIFSKLEECHYSLDSIQGSLSWCQSGQILLYQHSTDYDKNVPMEKKGLEINSEVMEIEPIFKPSSVLKKPIKELEASLIDYVVYTSNNNIEKSKADVSHVKRYLDILGIWEEESIQVEVSSSNEEEQQMEVKESPNKDSEPQVNKDSWKDLLNNDDYIESLMESMDDEE